MLDAVPATLAARVLAEFGDAIGRGDIAAASALFVEDCYWRDLVAFTWNLATCEGRGQVEAMLAAQLVQAAPSNWHLAEGEAVGFCQVRSPAHRTNNWRNRWYQKSKTCAPSSMKLAFWVTPH